MNLDNPFIRYRRHLDSYRRGAARGMSDSAFVHIVEQFDDAIADVDGHGFTITPFAEMPALASALGVESDLWVKNDTENVGHSHKARHLFGLALHLAVEDNTDGAPLAIASCGNAALAAGVVAKAMDRDLKVFVPTWADAGVLDRLSDLGAQINVSERRPNEKGDPAYLRFREAVDGGAYPFSVQGTDAPATLDGGRTMGWEIGEQLRDADTSLDRIYIQVGGGALASSTIGGLADAHAAGWIEHVPRLYPVQAEGCAPLAKAWTELLADGDTEDSVFTVMGRARGGHFMRPWENPHSAATGILDDVTYDWLTIIEPMLVNGGQPVVASEAEILEAHRIGTAATGIVVSPTGTAGLAGLLHHVAAGSGPKSGELAAVLFTGRE